MTRPATTALICEVTCYDTPITLEHVGGNEPYRVTYGLQVSTFSNLADALDELKYCVLHSAECVGVRD